MKPLFAVILLISILINIAFIYITFAKNPMKLQGEQSWIDLYSNNSDATVKFLNNTLGIKLVSSSKENDIDYRVIKSKNGLFPYAGIMQIDEENKKNGLAPHATVYLTVKNYDKTHKAFVENGAKPIVENMIVKNMKFGVYVIPGGLDIAIVEYGVKE